MRRLFLFKIASTNGLAALPVCSHRAFWRQNGERHSADASTQGCAFAKKRRQSLAIAQTCDQRKRAGGNQTKGTGDEKSQEDRDFCLLAFAATSVADARFLQRPATGRRCDRD